ncbi:hypothetical protein, conserved [Eimeria maxima]|uniref:Uncharacterized protein n=1 Tax=Eimeria maxima TaxID=5804 RepID=U6LYI2_EIMMA|nr:hypothetical protein, conserved [Eimeria maxima]CDJ55928.1 hypothetical protein, conserved [Eimeria maxima]
MEQRSSCSVKAHDSQVVPSPHDSESEECKRPDTEEQCEFVRCHRMVAEDEEPLFGPLRLKDGLFCSLRSIAVGKEFLKTHKISHIVAIDDGPQQPYNDLQGVVETDESTPTVPPRRLKFQWEQKGRSIDPASVKQKLKDLATAVAFIDEAIEQGGSCLLHSSKELGTAAAAATVYFVVK